MKNFWSAYKKIILLVVFLWIVFAISRIFPINNFGIIPRTVAGLPGIICAPFLHQNLVHITENSIGLFILGFFMILLEENRIYYTLVPVVILGGAGTWIIGRADSVHLGASGVIFGMLGYLVTAGLFRRDLKSIIISVVVLLFYGGMVFGVLPTIPQVSWESHLCGFIAGIITASGTKVKKRK
jgi:membrane associated rhomboid family serine protease